MGVKPFYYHSEPGKFLSLSLWRDEEAVAAWHAHAGHNEAQDAGKSGLFADFLDGFQTIRHEHSRLGVGVVEFPDPSQDHTARVGLTGHRAKVVKRRIVYSVRRSTGGTTPHPECAEVPLGASLQLLGNFEVCARKLPEILRKSSSHLLYGAAP